MYMYRKYPKVRYISMIAKELDLQMYLDVYLVVYLDVYIKIHRKIHHDTSGYVSDRKLHQKR